MLAGMIVEGGKACPLLRAPSLQEAEPGTTGGRNVMTAGQLFSLFLIVLAPAVGSFLAVLVDRLPRGEDVLRQPSACRTCGQRLRAWDLVPVLSFVWLRGRCRHCQAALPPGLIYVEILATGAAVLAVIAGRAPGEILLSSLFLWLLLALAACDLRWMRLPDVLVAALFATSLGWASAGALPSVGLEAALLGAVLGSGSFWALRLGYQALRGREGLGLGDVKLMAGLGAFAGPWDLALLVLLAALMALAAALMVRWRAASAGPFALMALPFGTALCGAGFLLWLLRVGGLLPL